MSRIMHQHQEDLFIERCRKEFGSLTFEAEMLLRYGYGSGASDIEKAAYTAGVDTQRDQVLAALGAAPVRKIYQP